tara:strand:+ start:143 stop:253 length:111 start_codon:yes stop_codon:yes gene_type:complete
MEDDFFVVAWLLPSKAVLMSPWLSQAALLRRLPRGN